MTDFTKRSYYIQQLTSIAEESLDEIIDRRSSAIGLAKPIGHRSRWEGYEIARSLESLRASFWQTPPSSIALQIDSFDLATYQEFKGTANRLKLAAAAMNEWGAASAKLDKQQLEFLEHFKSTIDASPRKIAEIKEFVCRTLQRYPQGQHYKSAAEIIRTQFSLLRAIDPSWIDQVASEKRIGRRYQILPMWSYILAVLVLVCVIGAIGFSLR